MLTTGEVAKLFQVSAQTVINWLDQGRMHYERIGRGPRRLTEETVLNYIKEIGISHTALDQAIYEKLTRRLTSVNGDAKSSAVAIASPDLLMIAWNDDAKSLTGLPAAEVLGRPLSDFVSRADGSEESLVYLIKNSWKDNALEVSVLQKLKTGKSQKFDLTVSKFYAQGKMAGYAIAFRPIP